MGTCPNMWGSVWHCTEHPVLLVYHCCITLVFLLPFWAILGGRASDVHPKHVILFANVTLLNDAVTSYVMSQYCMCIGYMTFYYKRAANTSVGDSCLLFVCSSGLTLSPETHVWMVSNMCRSQCIWHISGWEPTSFNSNCCVSL